jgi:ribosomal protein S18 acetylase RimI-like enzyme
VRLLALSEAPDAFETRYDDAVRRSDDWWIEWAARSAESDRQAMFLAWDGGTPVGIVGAYVERQRCWLISMWTDPSMRCRGIGAALVEVVVGFARAAGYADLFLTVRVQNEQARRLYERCGFLETGEGVEEREMSRAL